MISILVGIISVWTVAIFILLGLGLMAFTFDHLYIGIPIWITVIGAFAGWAAGK